MRVGGDGGSSHLVHRGFVLAVVEETEPLGFVTRVRILVVRPTVPPGLLQPEDDVPAQRAVEQGGLLRDE